MSPPSLLFVPQTQESALRSSDIRVVQRNCKQSHRSFSPVLQCHFRVTVAASHRKPCRPDRLGTTEVGLTRGGTVCIQWSESLTRVISPIPRQNLSQVQIQSSWAQRFSTTPPMGFGSFRRNGSSDRYCAGLPPQHHPSSEFLTLSTV